MGIQARGQPISLGDGEEDAPTEHRNAGDHGERDQNQRSLGAQDRRCICAREKEQSYTGVLEWRL